MSYRLIARTNGRSGPASGSTSGAERRQHGTSLDELNTANYRNLQSSAQAYGGSTQSRHRHDRPNSAPTYMHNGGSSSGSSSSNNTNNNVVAAPDTSHVEQRLTIVKRSRAVARSASASGPTPPNTTSPRAAAAAPATAVAPPCAAFPTFNTSRLPKHEQHVMEAMVSECLDAILFPV